MGFRFEYTGIRVRDLDRSIAFYRDLLGLQVTYRGPIEPTGGELAVLECRESGARIELNQYSSDHRFDSSYREGDELDHLAFAVDDVYRAIDQLRARGVVVKQEPPGVGKVPTGYVLDPDGIWVELRPGKPSSAPRGPPS